MNARGTILLASTVVFLAACGGYSVPHSKIDVVLSDITRGEVAIRSISDFLEIRGFQNHGVDNEMIALLRHRWPHETARDREFNDAHIQLLLRKLRYTKESADLIIDVIDYSDIEIREQNVHDNRRSMPFIEITIHNDRPGGFSESAREFHASVGDYLRRSNLGDIRVAANPPKDDWVEYFYITIVGFISGLALWLVVLLIPLVVIAVVVRRTPWLSDFSSVSKRTIFVLLGVFFATPLPFPAASILVIPLPSALVWIAPDPDYFYRIREYIVPTLLGSFLVSTALAIRIFTSEKETSNKSVESDT